MEKVINVLKEVKGNIAQNFKSSTLNFIFMILFINAVQLLFGAENAVLGLILAPLILVLMARDLTARPVKHVFIQAFVLCSMAVAACLQAVVGSFAALCLNFGVMCVILYAFTSDYTDQLYFQYLLGYLFLIFLGPIPPEHLPKRLAGMVVGSLCIMLYQWYKGKNRISKITTEVLLGLLDQAQECMNNLLAGKKPERHPQEIRAGLARLGKIIDERKKKLLCISDASFAALEAGRGLEEFVLKLYETDLPAAAGETALLRRLSDMLVPLRAFILQERADIPEMGQTDGFPPEAAENCRQQEAGESGSAAETEGVLYFYRCLEHIREHLLTMVLPESRRNFKKTALPFSAYAKGLFNFDAARLVYALRLSCLLAFGILFVRHFQLPHGKWLLFTIASVSLPYADDVGAKAKKRIGATLIGGLAAVLVFSLVPSPAGRIAIMMLVGYISFYLPDYLGNFSCATMGALGGAVLTTGVGWGAVGGMALIRLGYIALGILVALVCNCLILPSRRARATRQLGKKYASVSRALVAVCGQEQADHQVYYNLIINMRLLEAKLRQNAAALQWDGVNDFLEQHRKQVSLAHRLPAEHTAS